MVQLTPTLYKQMIRIRKRFDAHFDIEPMVIHVPKTIAEKCISQLTNNAYKASIIAIQPMYI